MFCLLRAPRERAFIFPMFLGGWSSSWCSYLSRETLDTLNLALFAAVHHLAEGLHFGSSSVILWVSLFSQDLVRGGGQEGAEQECTSLYIHWTVKQFIKDHSSWHNLEFSQTQGSSPLKLISHWISCIGICLCSDMVYVLHKIVIGVMRPVCNSNGLYV